LADEAHRLGETEPLDLTFEIAEFLAFTRERQRDRVSVGVQPRYSIDQEVGTFDVPEFADIDDVRGIRSFDDWIEFVRGNTIEYAAHKPCGYADCALIRFARERAFEQKQVSGVHQGAFHTAVQRALQRIQRVMQ
jgi:hypothetical protein